jgi:uncharacterized OsmC-like protein
MTVDTDTPTHPNGVAITAIRQAREAMAEQPDMAQFTWRATNRWVRGTHSVTSIDGFDGLGAEQRHREVFTSDTDHPEVFAAEDRGPTPVEFVLHALAGCLTAGVATVAANRGVQLTEVTSTVEGDMDLRGIMGVDRAVRNGYTRIRVSFDVKGDADPDQLRDLVAQSTRRSAVYDVLTNGVDVDISVTA